ncbi:hypothetical protein CAPTEDRAFT_214492 [Capitella teleta]|uniref:SGNH hydrolase-type esterase domain-containing protein n=1 Tax=Capitella teleta TaxID=283909 RepID=R7TKD7_CAPTE|nr:hypothetical protein CAPTEDRAFT_214492 [Capitella teleta]|eukprot:ELT93952.1 hypothetical protein CAPTEDRAFT_214492 [Capitella teleta]
MAATCGSDWQPVASSMHLAIVGDSFVVRLKAFIQAQGADDLNIPGTTVHFYGLGGASVYGHKKLLPLLNQAIVWHCDRIFVHIGSNDLCNRSVNPHALAEDLRRLAVYASFATPSTQVIVGQVFQRLSEPDPDYNRRVHHELCDSGIPPFDRPMQLRIP